MESLTCVKGSAARFVIDRGIDRLRPSGNRTMTNFGPRADLSPTIGSTWPKSPWRREIIRTSDTSPSTMGVFCVDRGSQDDHRVARPPHAPLRHRRDRQRKLALQEPRLTRDNLSSTKPRSPRLRNPDQLRRGERCRRCPVTNRGQFWTPIGGQNWTPIDILRPICHCGRNARRSFIELSSAQA